MKVNVGQLKAKLSQYLREIQATGETLEVCVREAPVAYLMPSSLQAPEKQRISGEMDRLAKAGLQVIPASSPKKPLPSLGKTGDRLKLSNTVVAMRAEKDW